MAKKTARPAAKPSQQRTKEDQWRRRMSQQAQVGVGSVVAESDGTGATASYVDGTAQTASAKATRAASTSTARRTANTSAVSDRKSVV